MQVSPKLFLKYKYDLIVKNKYKTLCKSVG